MKEKFTNVFELLAYADASGRVAEVKHGDVWVLIGNGEFFNLNTLRERFNRGEIRLKPKLKTVEGWITVVPHKHAYLAVHPHPFAVPGQSLFRSREDARSMLGGTGVVAKVTFEMEE